MRPSTSVQAGGAEPGARNAQDGEVGTGVATDKTGFVGLPFGKTDRETSSHSSAWWVVTTTSSDQATPLAAPRRRPSTLTTAGAVRSTTAASESENCSRESTMGPSTPALAPRVTSL